MVVGVGGEDGSIVGGLGTQGLRRRFALGIVNGELDMGAEMMALAGNAGASNC